jgi:four helix bundle protein
MKNNVIQEKSYQFALKIIKVYKNLTEVNKEYALSKQLLRCGTSIGANIEESIRGQSDKDFFSKITIAYKEARETHYWIRLLRDSGYIDSDLSIDLFNDCDEPLKIIGSIQKTMSSKIRNS